MEIGFEVAGSVAHITLDRPNKLNALTPAMLATMEERIHEVNANAAIKAMVISGRGRCFSVGADINIWSNLTHEEFRTGWIADGHRAMNAVAQCRVPVIAAIHGMAFGGGLELGMAADLRVAERDAMLGLPEVSLGTVPGWGGTLRLAELVGRSRAKQMILAAERIGAERAEAWGLVNSLCEPGEALAEAFRIANRTAELAPVAVQLAKRIIDAGNSEAVMALELLGGVATQSTDDLKEGIAAFQNKRDPRFTGA